MVDFPLPCRLSPFMTSEKSGESQHSVGEGIEGTLKSTGLILAAFCSAHGALGTIYAPGK